MQGFHLVQSFAASEVTPELAHQIGLEFADRLLHGNFQAVISTHLNTKCIQYEFCQGYFLPKLYIFSVHYS